MTIHNRLTVREVFVIEELTGWSTGEAYASRQTIPSSDSYPDRNIHLPDVLFAHGTDLFAMAVVA